MGVVKGWGGNVGEVGGVGGVVVVNMMHTAPPGEGRAQRQEAQPGRGVDSQRTDVAERH